MSFQIFKYEGLASPVDWTHSPVKFEVWKPSYRSFVPPGLPRKYIVFWLFRQLRTFANRNYYAVLGYVDGNLACSFLIVPKYFKWPFMRNEDVQFVYVKTYPDYRGQGYATQLLSYGCNLIRDHVDTIWYVTDNDNVASQALAAKAGFKFFAYGYRGHLFNIKFLKTLKIQ